MAAPRVSLFDSEDVSRWRNAHELYPKVVAHKASQLKKPDKAKKLLELDKWYQEQLPREIGERPEKYLTLEELTKLMDWKLTRGKFRPRLMQLVQTNTPESVVERTKKAFHCLPNLDKAMQQVTQLKAVGPATASAILCAGCSEVPFMADEAMQAIPGFGRIDYTVKCYQSYLNEVRECVKRLKAKDPEGNWNEHKVEVSLWSHAVALKLAPELLQQRTAVKRATEDEKLETPSERAHKRKKVQNR